MSRVAMKTYRKNEVPNYLHQSERFVSSVDLVFSVREDCIKPDLRVNTFADLDHLLRTMQYWDLRSFPDELVRTLIENYHLPEVEEELLKYSATFPRIVPLMRDLFSQKDSDWCTIAAEHGMVEFLRYFVKKNVQYNFHAMRLAAENGHIECVIYLHKLFVHIKKPVEYKNFNYIQIVEHGHVHVLRFIVEHGRRITENMCVHAAACGQLSCLNYLLSTSIYRSERITAAAARSSNALCLQYTLEQRCAVGLSTWQAAAACKDANNLEILFAQDSSFVLPAHLAEVACRAGSVPCLRWLYEHGCPADNSAITAAAQGGSFDCLQFLHSELEMDCWVTSTMETAAGANQVKLVQKLVEMNCQGDRTVIAAAVATSAKACLLYLLEQGKLKWN